MRVQRYLALTVSLVCCVGGGVFSGDALAVSKLPPPSPAVMQLARECAPQVHPMTVGYLVAGESSNNPLAININRGAALARQPRDRAEAEQTVAWLERHGANFDVGLGQVNSANFRTLGLRGSDLLEPCANLRASQTVLLDCYGKASKSVGPGQPALLRALSCYNTGSQVNGFTNGYVRRFVQIAKAYPVPALDVSGPGGGDMPPATLNVGTGSTAAAPVAAAAGGMVGKNGRRIAKDSDGAFSQIDPGAFGESPSDPP
jgi:type IV secretion system protein VirB1